MGVLQPIPCAKPRATRWREELMMLTRLFREHPQEVGESYAEHFAAAGGFGVKMIVGVVHALVPGLFITTGSGTVKNLYDQMVAKRAAKRDANIEMRSIEYVI
jgi:hypothetical protein